MTASFPSTSVPNNVYPHPKKNPHCCLQACKYGARYHHSSNLALWLKTNKHQKKKNPNKRNKQTETEEELSSNRAVTALPSNLPPELHRKHWKLDLSNECVSISAASGYLWPLERGVTGQQVPLTYCSTITSSQRRILSVA